MEGLDNEILEAARDHFEKRCKRLEVENRRLREALTSHREWLEWVLSCCVEATNSMGILESLSRQATMLVHIRKSIKAALEATND